MKTLRSKLELAIYGDETDSRLGVDPDRVAVDDGVDIVLDAVVSWLKQDEIRDLIAAAYTDTMQSEGKEPAGSFHSIQRKLLMLAED